MKELFELQSDVCKTMANPKRMEIIYLLKGGEMNSGELTAALGLAKANVSQHLSVLRNAGIVRSRREGVNVFYSISNSKILKACALMREVMVEMMEESGELLKKMKKVSSA